MRQTVLLAALGALPAMLLFAGAGDYVSPTGGKTPPEGAYPVLEAEGTGISFDLERTAISEYDGAHRLFSLSVERITDRKRRSRFVVYHNLSEIVLRKVEMRFADPSAPRSRSPFASIPFERLKGSLDSLAGGLASAGDYEAAGLDSDFRMLSRVLIDDVSVRVSLADRREAVLSAGHARISPDFGKVVLNGNVTLLTADGDALRTSEAVWSREHDGLFVPGAHTLHGREHRGPALYRITSGGSLLRRSPTPRISYADPIEQREAAFFSDLVRGLPMETRLVFGLSPAP